MGKIETRDNLFGDGKSLYNEYGEKIGEQRKNLFDDGVSTYDKYGNKVSETRKNLFDDGVSTYDIYGNKVSETRKNLFDDGVSTYDVYGNKVSETRKNLFNDGYTTYGTSSDSTYGMGGLYSGAGSSYGGPDYGGYSPVPYSGYYGSALSPREKKKNRICGTVQTVSIIAAVAAVVYLVAALIFPSRIPLRLTLFEVVFYLAVFVMSFSTVFMYGEGFFEDIAWVLVPAVVGAFGCGQATYNAHGYNSTSASMAYRAVARYAGVSAVMFVSGWLIGKFCDKMFSGGGRDGKAGTVFSSLVVLTAGYGLVSAFTGIRVIGTNVYICVAAAAAFAYLFCVLRSRGKGGIIRGLLLTAVITGAFTSIVYIMMGVRSVRVMFRVLTSRQPLPYYIIFAAACLLGMLAGGIVKKRR